MSHTGMVIVMKRLVMPALTQARDTAHARLEGLSTPPPCHRRCPTKISRSASQLLHAEHSPEVNENICLVQEHPR